MNSKKSGSFFIERRRLLTTLLISPLLINKSFANPLQATSKDVLPNEDFIIVNGWVLLKNDLVEDLV